MHLRLISRTAAVVGAGVLAVPLAAAAAHAGPAARTTVPGSVPAWAQPAHATGTPAASQKVAFSVALPLRNEAAAEQLARSVSDPSSPN